MLISIHNYRPHRLLQCHDDLLIKLIRRRSGCGWLISSEAYVNQTESRPMKLSHINAWVPVLKTLILDYSAEGNNPTFIDHLSQYKGVMQVVCPGRCPTLFIVISPKPSILILHVGYIIPQILVIPIKSWSPPITPAMPPVKWGHFCDIFYRSSRQTVCQSQNLIQPRSSESSRLLLLDSEQLHNQSIRREHFSVSTGIRT